MPVFSEKELLALANKTYKTNSLSEIKIQSILNHTSLSKEGVVNLLTNPAMDERIQTINELKTSENPINSSNCLIGISNDPVKQILAIREYLLKQNDSASLFNLPIYLKLRELILIGLIDKEINFWNTKESFHYCLSGSELEKVSIVLMYELADSKKVISKIKLVA